MEPICFVMAGVAGRRARVSGLGAGVSEMATAVRRGEVRVEDQVAKVLRTIADRDATIRAFVSLDAERALEQARRIDAKRASGVELGPLAGVPVAVKDNLCVRGSVTTAGSRILENFVAPYDATAVARLVEADAVILGKTNMDEFGMGSSTETSAFGATRNPVNEEFVPGGSSGGSAAAIASGMVPLALGTDTGGSVRQPASFCGVVGLKCSYGRVSRHGLLSYASSLDTVGPMGTTVADVALLLRVIAGQCSFDGTSSPEPVPQYLEHLTAGSLRGRKLGLIDDTLGEGVDDEVRNLVESSAVVFRELGATVERVSIPNLAAATAAYYVLAPAEASANLARYDGIRYGSRASDTLSVGDLYTRTRAEGFGKEVKRRIMVGTFSLSSGYYQSFYLRAQRVRGLITQQFRELFDQGFDLLLSPVSPTTAFRLGEKLDDPVKMYLDDVMTIPASMAGLPSLSLPAGISSRSGLPIGLQITGRFLDEATVLQAGHLFEELCKKNCQG